MRYTYFDRENGIKPKPNRKRVNHEEKVQVAIKQYLEYNGYYVFSVPNEGKRSYVYASHLKKAGLKSGVADLVVLGRDGMMFFIECKAGKNKQTDSQIEFQREVESRGFKYFLAYGVKDIDFLKRA